MHSLTRHLSFLSVTWLTFAAISAAQSFNSLESLPPNSRPLALDSKARNESRASISTSLSSRAARHARVHWDTDANGTIWVRGRNYKASFGADGATYFPLFGSQQPRHFPVALSLVAATGAGQSIPLDAVSHCVRNGERVIIERGVIDEVYEIGVDGIEQTFVVGERPQGDLRLFVGIQTELAQREREDGFEFTCERGGVRYGRAFAREANGSKRALATRLASSGIEIDVDAHDLAAAQFPLVVDPLVSTFAIDTTTFDDFSPDVAYDATTDRYLYVYEETVTSIDSDMYSEITNSAGVVLSGSYIDLSTDSWTEPSVANLNAYDQFLVVAVVNPAGTSNWFGRGRQTSASTLAYGPVILIADHVWPFDDISVGGDPYPSGPAYYCVVWTHSDIGTNNDIHGRLVTDTGTLAGSLLTIDNSSGTKDGSPSVSKGNGGTRWNIAWKREIGASYSIHGAQVEWDGSTITTPSFQISMTGAANSPSAASPFSNGDYVVTWADYTSPNFDVLAALISGGSVISTVNLMELEGLAHMQARGLPSVDCDGEQFAVVFSERFAVNDRDVYVSSFHVLGGLIGLSESHVAYTGLSTDEIPGSIVSTHSTGGAARRFALSWYVNDPTNSNVYGGLYDTPIGGPITTFCSGDGSGTACPCGNNGTAGRGCASSVNPAGARLSASGNADLSGDNVVLIASGLPATANCLFFQGTSAASGGVGSLFGDGLRCAAGTVIRLGTKTASSGVASYPTGTDLDVSIKGAVPAVGATRYYQNWYRNAAAFCTASTFNLTNGLRITWLP